MKARKDILLATNNEGKVERFRKLLADAAPEVVFYIPKDLGIETVSVKENEHTLAENAEKKARAYFGKAHMPILANDTGFYVDGEGFIDAPKREALGEVDESALTKNEIAEKLLEFWKNIARKHGGAVDAAWIEAFALLDTDGRLRTSESRREVVLTDNVFGNPHIQMPVRCLYISKTTNKPSIQHTKEEEMLELRPVTDALCNVLLQ